MRTIYFIQIARKTDSTTQNDIFVQLTYQKSVPNSSPESASTFPTNPQIFEEKKNIIGV